MGNYISSFLNLNNENLTSHSRKKKKEKKKKKKKSKSLAIRVCFKSPSKIIILIPTSIIKRLATLVPKHLRFEYINRIVLEFGFSVVFWILRFKCVKFFISLSLQKKKKKKKKVLYGPSMFSDFSNVSGERHYGLDVYWVFIIYFRLGFFFF